MKFSDEGIIINLRKYGESSLIAAVFSRKHGIYKAFVKSIKSQKNKAIFQIGNLINFEFYAKMEDDLGRFTSFDLQKSYLLKVLFEKEKLNAINSVFSLINEAFLERESHEILFEKLQNFLQKISQNSAKEEEFLSSYILLELQILQDLGYGLDLSSCAGGGNDDNLAFISPKSGRAVSQEKGEPYKDKLFILPEIFISKNSANISKEDVTNGLKITGFFLEKFLLKENHLDKDSDKLEKPFFLRREFIKNYV